MSKSRIARSVEHLVFYTDTDETKEYPIFVTPSREVYIKKRPNDVVASLNVVFVSDSDLIPLKNIDALEKVLQEIVDERVKELARAAYTALSSLTSFTIFLKQISVKYEIYRGDFEEYLGEAEAKVLKLSAYAKFPSEERQAWAIAFSSAKRLSAKYSEISEYVYPDVRYITRVTDESIIVTKRSTPHAIVRVKIPVVSDELRKLFDRAVSAPAAFDTQVLELEKKVKELEELIRQKEQELQSLKEQHQQLLMKLQLERMKSQVV